jgi:ABC-type nickel/cobalt efflux system permease component RcnA
MSDSIQLKEQKGMTNETAKAVGGAAVSLVAAGASYAEQIEQWSRIGASWIAIASGCVVIWSVVAKRCRKKKGHKHEEN